jgi:O-6-methylguanine DNA methyltransferase
MINECIFKTPLAHMLLNEEDGKIIHASFTRRKLKKTSNPTLLHAQKEIIQYFKGVRKRFTIKINPNGSVYQKKVWRELLQIKYGHTKYYSDIAKILKSSPRAVGNACGSNKCLILIPCHRVISKDIKNGGFSSFGGIVHKDRLLKNEI